MSFEPREPNEPFNLPATSAGAAGAILALLLGWFAVQDGPRSARQSVTPLDPGVSQLEPDMVEARLWQDPFSAVSTQLSQGRKKISNSSNDSSKPCQSILVVPLRAQSGEEEAELRRRQRHALVSALARRSYEPVESGILRALEFPEEFVPRDANSLQDSRPTDLTDTPYEIYTERFRASPRPSEQICLVWIAEHLVMDGGRSKPHHALDAIADKLIPGQNSGPIRTLVISPGDSDSFKTILEWPALGPRKRHPRRPWPTAEPTTDSVDFLVESADAYLDEGLVGAYRAAFVTAIQDLDLTPLKGQLDLIRENMTVWLRGRPDIRSIEDVNPNWFETVVERNLVRWLTGRADIASAFGAYLDICMFPNETSENSCEYVVRQLEIGLTPYLGLGDTRNAEELDTSLNRLIRRLQGLDLWDSDPEWAIFVISEWVAWKGPIGPTPLPPQQRTWNVLVDRATLPRSSISSPSEHPIHLAQTSSTDDRNLDLIFSELERRRINPLEDGIVLVSEWDTSYGRTLPRLFRERAGEGARIRTYSYLRGLDGILPRSGADSTDLSRSQTSFRQSDGNSSLVDSLSRLSTRHSARTASGSSQFDYADRLGQKIVTLDRDLRQKGERGVRAIGVVGSDFHDKQVILQILRQRFPGAVFFTTDLDARYLDIDKRRWNRNLLIASSYGLSLAPGLQGDIPPFRDTYATSMFLTGMLAVDPQQTLWDLASTGNLPKPCSNSAVSQIESLAPLSECLDSLLKPRLFEVSRNGLVDLTPVDARSILHPERQTYQFPSSWALLLFLLVPLLGVTLTSTWPLDLRLKETQQRLKSFALAALALVVLLGALALVAHTADLDGKGEPLLWFEGVSVWPSQMLRVLAIWLCVILILRAHQRIRFSEGRIARYLEVERDPDGPADLPAGPPTTALGETPPPSLWTRLRSAVGRYWCDVSLQQMLPRAADDDQPVDAPRLWSLYLQRTRSRCRWLRVGFMVLLFLLPVVVLYNVLEPAPPPARGGRAYNISHWAGYVTVFATSVLTLWVFDAILLGLSFVRTLSSGTTHWPETPTARKIVEGRRLPSLDLVREKIDIEVIARLTRGLWITLGYPFAVMALLLFAQSDIFDAWGWPWAATIVLTALALLTLLASFLLRRAAKTAQTESLHRLDLEVSKLYGADQDHTRTIEQLDLLRRSIENEKRGAFGGWMSNPLAKTGIVFFAVLLLTFLEIAYG